MLLDPDTRKGARLLLRMRKKRGRVWIQAAAVAGGCRSQLQNWFRLCWSGAGCHHGVTGGTKQL